MAPTVVSASIGVLGPLVVKLGSLLNGQYGRLKGVRKEILALNLELSTINAAVQKYAMLEDPDIQVKQWISMVRELAYDIEDHIDKFIRRLGNSGRHGGFKESFRRIARSLKTLGSRHGISGQIEELKARIKHVKDLKNSYRLDDVSCSTSNHKSVDPRLSALFAEKAHLVGIDGPRDDLVKWMVEEGKNTTRKHRCVLSIVGFGGLGKTTLANQVYQKIEGDFDCRAFVSVSQKPDIKRIMKDVISQMSCKDGCIEGTTDNWDERRSITKLRELLKDKRYLIIIDDIWSTQAWNNVQCAFPENNYSSRIIITTRISDVAKSCCSCTTDRTYNIKALSDLHARELFFKRIFGSADGCPDMLKEVSDKILNKCGGLPLAIISISALLANKCTVKEEWEKVKRSIGHALEKHQTLEGVSTILSLSYNDLPPNLKTCLLYLSVFPEDCVISRNSLLRRWIAEGFVSEERGRSQYEVAESYFYELINKSMVQPVGEVSYDGKVRACKVHDMMLEIIISKSAEDNFVTVVGEGRTSLSNRHRVIRRLSVQYSDNELALALENEDLSHVRSLIVTAPGCIKHLPNLAKFEALRVLDFQGLDGLEQYDMNSVEKLFQLKYLSLMNTNISRLPLGIVMLSDLETLDFRGTFVEELPAGFGQLTKLQHLLAEKRTKIPSGIGNMSNLRDLGNLTYLSELSVYLNYGGYDFGSKCGGLDAYRMHEEKLLSSLHKLIGSCKLRSLSIYSSDSYSLKFLESWSMPSALQMFHMSTDYYFPNIPKWISPALTSLSSLNINLIELTEDGLRTLGELPALLDLILTLETGANKFTVQGIGFPSLKHLKICSGQGTYFVKGAMPKLEYLGLVFLPVGRNCGFYIGLAHLPCLKVVKIGFPPGCGTKPEFISATAAIKEEVHAHTNHPRFGIFYNWFNDMEMSKRATR
ncbi:disease resistance protein PIK6-NP-like [Lolium perenne]|uniref:disease resistance protein PIK6-NP-like n=1 Tax=Lolium perenne TaxID=4522 RepID=UPI0021F53DFC|nr:disease resistance protein PIK6-NP-like [Lolium perenne]